MPTNDVRKDHNGVMSASYRRKFNALYTEKNYVTEIHLKLPNNGVTITMSLWALYIEKKFNWYNWNTLKVVT